MSGHILLIGFMGAGKSTVATILAERLERPCIDLDARIETVAGTSIIEVFAAGGEEAFRDLEAATLADLAAEPPSVVACGGGVVVRPENRELLARLGIVVYLQVTAGEAIARVGDAGTRPLLSGEGASLAATSLLQARRGLYRAAADIIVDTVGFEPDQIADQVERALLERGDL